jgi:2-succinyl-5-enolpyruvyl-6-hydroxy-3-cyclohexene-1-carboxylate synthase
VTPEGPSQLLTEWASLLMGSLAEAGVRDVVISPGSRSTPFVIAASREPSLRCHVVIDERSAGFFALGLARASGRPTLLLCTSGTAPAHYFPAVIEASQSFVPLLVLSADRPFDLQDCAAPQTVDQLKLFGDHVRRFVELGLPDATPVTLRALRRTAAQVVFDSTWPTPGPVHLNARARKPLEPIAARDEAERLASERVRASASRPLVRAFAPAPKASSESIDFLVDAISKSKRGLIVAGPAAIAQGQAREAVAQLVRASGLPLLCDATSQLRFGHELPMLDASDVLLGSTRFREAKPDLLVQLGPAPTAAGWEALLAALPDVNHVVVAPHGWNDPSSTASAVVFADVGESARAVAERLGGSRSESSWEARACLANAAAWRAVSEVLEPLTHLSEAQTARSVVGAVPESGALFVGNSLPIRHVDAYCPATTKDIAVFSQRGANGIDGLISGAAGVAANGRPTALLVGDVSALHDVGGLAIAREAKSPLVIVVIQNGGGRIFEQLPVARSGLSETELRAFTTPHSLTFGAAADLFGIPYRRVDSRRELDEMLTAAFAHEGCTLIEAIVPPHEAYQLRSMVTARAEALIAQAWGEP